MIINNKKGTELTLQTVVTFIILIIVLIVMIYFFSDHYGSNSDAILDVGKSAIDNAQNN